MPSNTPIVRRFRTPRYELPDSEFLRGIAKDGQEYILGAAAYREVAARDVIIHGGHNATHLFLLCSGHVRYYKVTSGGDELLLQWLVPGDVFGLATLLDHPPDYMGSAQADVECAVYGWTHYDMRELVHTYPQLAENALRITLSYLAAYTERHSRLLKESAEQRLARTLIHLAKRAGQVQKSGVHLNVTNEQLGSLADVGSFTTSRFLKAWERKGAICKTRGSVHIQAPEKLVA